MRKQSFLERLTGARVDDDDSASEGSQYTDTYETPYGGNAYSSEIEHSPDQEDAIAQLAIDLIETEHELILHSMIAGVTPEHLHISISRDSVTIRGLRVAPAGIAEDQFHIRELYWGPFVREILLPAEIDTDNAEAVEKYGLLIIRMPKLDPKKTAELKVKSM